jgi:hypothetical protein
MRIADKAGVERREARNWLMRHPADGDAKQRHSYHLTSSCLALATAIAGIGLHQASAQQLSNPPFSSAGTGIEVLATPYLWLPYIDTTVRPQRFASRSATVDPGTLVDNLTWVPFMGEFEFRNGPFGLMVDYIHAPLKSGIDTRNILFNGAQAGLTMDTGTAMFLYRPVSLPDQSIDVGVGFRAWGFDGRISLNEGLLRPVTVSNGGAWADPLFAVRYHREFGNGFSATAYGDAGGFGAGADLDWELLGTIDYALRPGIDLHAGFRSLNFKYNNPRTQYEVHMNGPIVSATLHF